MLLVFQIAAINNPKCLYNAAVGSIDHFFISTPVFLSITIVSKLHVATSTVTKDTTHHRSALSLLCLVPSCCYVWVLMLFFKLKSCKEKSSTISQVTIVFQKLSFPN